MKIKEAFKTIILTGLVISALVLSSKIWFSEELWPEGYNSFFSGIFSVFNSNDAESLDLSQIFFPKQVLVTKDDRSQIVSPNSNDYPELISVLKEHMKSVFLNGEFEDSSEEEYKKICESSSLFVGFYNYVSFEMLADYYDAESNLSIREINHVKNVLFYPDSENGNLSMYVKNNETDKVYKTTITENTDDLNALVTKIISGVKEGSVTSSFAFENNFDKKTENDTGRLLLDSYMLINLNESEIPDIVPVNLMDFNNENYSQIARCFKVNTDSARRFTDTEGAVNLIENFGTLKFNTDGLLEYTSVNYDKGIDLEDDILSDYDAVKLAGEFSEGINAMFNLPENNEYVFAGVEVSEDRVYTVYFDQLYNGIPIVVKRPVSNKETLNHAIEVKLYDGMVISYKQLFRGFNKINSDANMPPMIATLDKFYTIYDVKNNPDIIIDDIYNIYYFEPALNKVESANAVLLSNEEVVLVK